MKVLCVHTQLDSGSDSTTTMKVVDTDDFLLGKQLRKFIKTGNPPHYESQSYETFLNELEACQDINFPVTIDKIVEASTLEY